MARLVSFVLFVSLVWMLPNGIFPESDADLVSDLLARQQRAPSGIIHLDDHSLRRFITSPPTPRPYSLIIFFDVAQLRDKHELRLPQLRSEFGLVASSFIMNNGDNPPQLFFCDIEFKESQSSFAAFGVNSLPHIRLILPHVKNLSDAVSMDQIDFSRLSEGISSFIESRTGFSVGPIEHPPPISKTQMIVLVLILLISSPFVVNKIVNGDTLLHEPKVWLAGSIFVYFFSVSGMMYNVIRNMPMFIPDRNDPSKLVFFYHGSGMQLGTEGFSVGFLYTGVGVLIAVVVNGLVYAKNTNFQRAGMYAAMPVSLWAVKKVVYLGNWKTGYHIHGYWPSPSQ